MNSFERKYGKYAINNLPLIIIMCYAVGYIIRFINPTFLTYLALDPYKIIHGQVWRIVSWIILPPSSSNILLTMLLLFCVYSIAVSIERIIGTFQFNLYIFTGIFLTVLFAMLLMAFLLVTGGSALTSVIFEQCAGFISSYFIYMTLFVVFALSFPEARFLFMFIIPVKAKWMVLIYVYEFVMDFLAGNIFVRISLVAALVNFGLFWLRNKRGAHISPKEFKRKMEYRAATAQAQKPAGVTRHKCAICGRTEIDSPGMQFRFCSKCEGNYEYCEEHLYTHTHVHSS